MSLLSLTFLSLYGTKQLWDGYLDWINYKFQKNQDNLANACHSLGITQDEFQKSMAYAQANHFFSQCYRLKSLVVFCLFFSLGGFSIFESVVARLPIGSSDHPLVQTFYFFLIWQIFSSVTKFGYHIYRQHFLRKKYDLPVGHLSGFMTSQCASFGISTLINALIPIGLAAAIVYFPHNWWMVGVLYSGGVVFIIMFIYPVLIQPIVEKSIPFDVDSTLFKKINHLIAKSGLNFFRIGIIKDKKSAPNANAHAIGIGYFKKILFHQTFIEGSSESEVLAICAHEIGHHAHKHLWKLCCVNLILITLTIFPLYSLATHAGMAADMGFNETTPYVIVFQFYLWGMILQTITKPLSNGIFRRLEYQADAYAAKLTSPQNMIQALKKIYIIDANLPHFHSMYSWYNRTHPTLLERVTALDTSMSPSPQHGTQ